MQRIEIVALLSDSKKIMERLQRRGIVEVSDCTEEEFVKLNTAASIQTFEQARAKVEKALEILRDVTGDKASLLASLKGKREYIPDDFGKKAAGVDRALQKAYDILDDQKRIADCKSRIAKLTVLRDSLAAWTALDVPMNCKGTSRTNALIGSLPAGTDLEKLREQTEDVYIEVVRKMKTQTNVFVLCRKEKEQETYDLLRRNGFSALSGTTGKTATERIGEIEKEIADLGGAIDDRLADIRDHDGMQKDLEFVIDYLGMRADKYKALGKLGMTRETFVLTGYIPKKYAPALVRELDRKYRVAISLFAPEADDDVPVLLENNGFSAPVEGITEMYALPAKGDVDPTPVMAFFYYLFFGMMLSDAGYGVLMVLFTSLVLRKGKPEPKMRKTMKMFLYCGISTVFWGALFGSWFGDAVQVIARDWFGREIGSLALWFEPLDDPIRLLLFSFGLGICHLFLGLSVNFYKLWKAGQKLDAVCDVIPVMLTVLGVAPMAAGILVTVPPVVASVGKYVAMIGVILVVLTAGRSSKSIPMRFFGGIYGLYNIATGYLSDILSYSRLLALGLATGCIASVINLIGAMPQNMVVKTVLFILVFLVAHPANIAINLLGAYVHTDRLQFVELFSKFYEGGGRAFEPLEVNTKYIKFREEQNNE